MLNVMAALPNVGGALYSTPQSLAYMTAPSHCWRRRAVETLYSNIGLSAALRESGGSVCWDVQPRNDIIGVRDDERSQSHSVMPHAQHRINH